MKKTIIALLLSPLAALALSPAALAQDEPSFRFSGRTAAMPPLSNRAMPAAPSVHKLSIGPLSNNNATLAAPPAAPGEDIVPPAGSGEIAIETLVRRAKHGEPEANYRLGLRYLAGDGVTRDLVEAFARIRWAAESGHARAVSLFYTLGAKLTAEEHGQAFDRSQKLRQVNPTK